MSYLFKIWMGDLISEIKILFLKKRLKNRAKNFLKKIVVFSKKILYIFRAKKRKGG